MTAAFCLLKSFISRPCTICQLPLPSVVHGKLENHILRIAPGYNMIKETVMQFLGNRPSPFSSVALAQIFGNETFVVAFVTEQHDNGWFTVFVPNPLRIVSCSHPNVRVSELRRDVPELNTSREELRCECVAEVLQCAVADACALQDATPFDPTKHAGVSVGEHMLLEAWTPGCAVIQLQRVT